MRIESERDAVHVSDGRGRCARCGAAVSPRWPAGTRLAQVGADPVASWRTSRRPDCAGRAAAAQGPPRCQDCGASIEWRPPSHDPAASAPRRCDTCWKARKRTRHAASAAARRGEVVSA